ncbi:MAG: GNAT family N-acetyltransferase, partial [Chloroflexi bacterium]|nr:GNAT family N-acetyltransferase [Chloroflexota bacterium]
AAGAWTHIGSCGLHRIQWRERSAELGISIGDRSYWGRGYGTDTVRTLVNHGFGTLNLNRIFLRVFAHNARAIRAYEKAGFQQEGRLREDHYFGGEYVDTLILSVLQSEWRAARREAQAR